MTYVSTRQQNIYRSSFLYKSWCHLDWMKLQEIFLLVDVEILDKRD